MFFFTGISFPPSTIITKSITQGKYNKLDNNKVWSLIQFNLLKSFIKKIYKHNISFITFILMILNEILFITNKDIFAFLLFNILIFQSTTDIINNDVYTIFDVLIVLFAYITKNNINELTTFIFPILLFIIEKIIHSIGKGDIELIFCLCFIFNIYEISLILLLSSIANILLSIFKKKNKYPFVPFISMGTFIIYYLYH